jgi:hypothetical protein
MIHDVLRHGLVHDRKDVGGCVVERVIQIKNPNPGQITSP